MVFWLLLLFTIVNAATFSERLTAARNQFLKRGAPINFEEAIAEMEEHVIRIAEQGACETCLLCSDAVIPFQFFQKFQRWLNDHPNSEKVGAAAIEQLVIKWNNLHPTQQLNCLSPGKCWLRGWCE